MGTKLLVASVGVLALGLSLAMAGPASAATTAPTMPAVDSFFAVNCNYNYTGGSSVWSMLTTGAATPLGIDTSVTCGAGGAYDSLADKYYFIEYPTGNTSSLASFDAATGVVTHIAGLNGAVTNAWQLIIDDASHAYVSQSGHLYLIDLTTATTALIGPIGSSDYAIAFNPVDGLIYHFNPTNISTINPHTGAGTVIHSGVTWTTGACPVGMIGQNRGMTGTGPGVVAFDSNGIAWIQMNRGCHSDIEAYNPVTNESWSTGTIFDTTHLMNTHSPYDVYSETFIIGRAVNIPTPAPTPAPTEEPTLASTGVDGARVGLLAAGGGGMALLGLGAFIVARRRIKATK